MKEKAIEQKENNAVGKKRIKRKGEKGGNRWQNDEK